MKWTALFIVFVIIQAIIASATLESSWENNFGPQANFENLSNEEKIAQYEGQLQQLKLLQESQAASQDALLEHGMDAEGFSFKQAVATESTAATAAAATGADQNKLKKLAAAMTAVKEDIMAKLREAQRESKWVKDVEQIVKQYKKKVKNVKKNLTKIRQDIKTLIKKKRQIRNAQIQEQLNERLSDANNDLTMVKSKLDAINAQQKAFEANRKKIAGTIAKINSELRHLRGEKQQEAKTITNKNDVKNAAPAPSAQTKPEEKKPEAKKPEDNKQEAKKPEEKKPEVPKEIKDECDKKCKTDKTCNEKCVKEALDKKNAPAQQKTSFLDVEAEDEDLLSEFAF